MGYLMITDFEKLVASDGGVGLLASDIGTIQVNVGLKCNQSCQHCHLESSPARTELMDWTTMLSVLSAAQAVGAKTVDITGGAPELNPLLPEFIRLLRANDIGIQLRTNLTAMLQCGLEMWARFVSDHEVALVASLPCYLEENVCDQRGAGVYEDSIQVIKRLNAAGYGVESDKILNLVYNPTGPVLPPGQLALEQDYRRHLRDRFGIEFSRLLTIINMPIGRFLRTLKQHDQYAEYQQLLRGAFNRDTVPELMCRHQLNVGWDGTLYDCDFNYALHRPVDHGVPNHIARFNPIDLSRRRIVTGDHCFACTAGCGSSCTGALI